MGVKSILFIALLIVGGVGYYLWGTIEKAPPEATLPGYTNALKNDEIKAQGAASTANLEIVQDAIRKYQAMKGGNPATLQDLVPEYIDHIPGGIQYDASTATVSVAQ